MGGSESANSQRQPLTGSRAPIEQPLPLHHETLEQPGNGTPGPSTPPPADRSPGNYSRLWKSPTLIRRGSSETLTGSAHDDEDLPAKYIGPEMKKAALKRRKFGKLGGSSRDSRHVWHSIKPWLPEMAWIIISWVCVIIMAVILHRFDGQPPPNRPGILNLNTFLAFFTSLATFAYIVPVIEGLGQLRWLRFTTHPRSLRDFDIIDQAMRGSYGSFLLLFANRGGTLGAFGALVSILAIVTSTATQEVVVYETASRPGDGIATASRHTTFSRNTGNAFSFDPNDTIEVKKAILSGAYLPKVGSTASGSQGVVCSTANCTWPEFTSLGICTKIANSTGHLKVSQEPDSDWGIGKPSSTNRAALSAVNMSLVIPNLHSLAVAVPSAPSISFKGSDIGAALLDVYLIFADPSFSAGGSPSFYAAEVLFHWCAQAHSIQVMNGNITASSTEVRSTIIENTATSLAAQFSGKFLSCAGSGIDCRPENWGQVKLQADDSSTTHLAIEELTGAYLSKLVADLMGGIGASVPRGGNFLQGLGPQVHHMDSELMWAVGANLFPDPFRPSDPAAQFQTISRISNNIASSLTTWLRLAGGTFVGSNATVTGTTLTTQTYVVVYWRWMAFLVSQIIVSAVFLSIIIVRTRAQNLHVVKSSSLATLAALDEESRMYLGSINDLSALRDRAERLHVKLDMSGALGLKQDGQGKDEEGQNTPAPVPPRRWRGRRWRR
ncbi:hypothetical protein B0H63DRAFT_543354 [Podospora didyma]|uniref:Uncharacterized protein n=1 Tax=Podospora didyma TaxID=330526 RepID=A0AAE0TZA1_9PEZI|nr:hypothetical protein B0H63DRAFT_543354 [Podospora didyma]